MSVSDEILAANHGSKVVSAAVLAHGLMVGDRATLKLGYSRSSALVSATASYGPFTEGNLQVINDLLDRRLAAMPVSYGPKEDDVREVVLTPNYENTAAFAATALRDHQYDQGATAPIVSLIEQIRYLTQTDLPAVQRIIERLERGGR